MRAWQAFVFCGCGAHASCGLAKTARADEAEPPLERVEVAMIGEASRDPLLFERIRSLFPPQTAVVASAEHQLDRRAVLSPSRLDTVYIWIRATEPSRARVYLTLSERGEQARYLFRDVGLDSGLDEVGSETLAEVAHSSARALWLGERQSSREALVDALERESRPESPPPLTIARDAPAAARRPRGILRLGVGAGATTHSSGNEGWLQEAGGFLGLEYRGRLSLRAAARYLVPTDFGVPPARVHLSGASGELRAGWLSSNALPLRVRVEAGLGALLGSVRASIVDAEPQAHALGAQDLRRGYALAAVGLEWTIGPAWLATSVDLRAPFGTTSYEVAGQAGASTSASLCPGGSLEVGFGFDPASR